MRVLGLEDVSIPPRRGNGDLLVRHRTWPESGNWASSEDNGCGIGVLNLEAIEPSSSALFLRGNLESMVEG
jgi:hypothetical protein